MKKTARRLVLGVIGSLFLFGTSGCNDDISEDKIVLRQLYSTFKNGSIDECKYNGQTVYIAGINAYDAGSAIYDKDGKIIGGCNYARNNPDSICMQLTGCETVYAVKNNIWGQPAVDKYKLGK